MRMFRKIKETMSLTAKSLIFALPGAILTFVFIPQIIMVVTSLIFGVIVAAVKLSKIDI